MYKAVSEDNEVAEAFKTYFETIVQKPTQLTFACSKLTIETLKQGMNYVRS